MSINLAELIKKISPTESEPSQIIINVEHFQKQKDYTELMTHILKTMVGALTESKANGYTEIDVHLNFPKNIKSKDLDRRFIMHLAKTMIEMFPDTLKSLHIYNPPTFFKLIWEVLKPICDKDMKRKIVIHKGNNHNLNYEEYNNEISNE